jgi:glutaredoxin-related protein
MKKIIVYGSPLCPGCVEAKDYLMEKGIEFVYQDITGDLGAMKRFLKIRDTNPLYEEVKAKGGIGIPTVLIDEELYIGPEKEELERLLG